MLSLWPQSHNQVLSSFHPLCSACAWNSRLGFPNTGLTLSHVHIELLLSGFITFQLQRDASASLGGWGNWTEQFPMCIYQGQSCCTWSFCRCSLWVFVQRFYTDTIADPVSPFNPSHLMFVIPSQTSTVLPLPKLTPSYQLPCQERLWVKTCTGKHFTQPRSSIYQLLLLLTIIIFNVKH